MSVTSELPDERRYGDYEIESFLGKGSIGKVYLAHHRRIGRRVALKTVTIEQRFEDDEERDEFYKRLQREAEVFAKMQYPNIVTLYEVGYDENDRVSYLATEYVDGESLLAKLRRTRPLPLEEALAIAFDILRGLAYAHSKSVIHRDIKPANILLTSEGQAKIADFGVARPFSSSLTSARSLVGTPSYMSPEQVRTVPVTVRSDLFSAGVVIYEMLTGKKPFAAPEIGGILYNVVNLVPPLASDVNRAVPVAIAMVVAKLLEKKPDDRYASANEALEALDAASRGSVIAGVDGTTATAPEPGFETIVAGSQDEETTPLALDVDSITIRRTPHTVPAALFYSVTAILLIALVASVVTLRRKIESEKPTAVITQAQLRETESKERMLAEARALTASGRFEDAVKQYDAFLARYPQSVVARDERVEAQQLAEAAAPKTEVTTVAKRPRKPAARETATEPEPEKHLSRWDRVKRWFRGK